MLKALRALGLYEQVLEVGQPLYNFRILNKKGKTLADTDHLLLSQRFGIQSAICVHRGDLQQVLLQELQPLKVHPAKRCKSIVQEKDSVSVTFEDGSPDTPDLLIGCDGIHSAVHQQVAPMARKRYAGYTCWRGVITSRPPSTDANKGTESWRNGDRFGIVPLTNDKVYWFACLNAPQAQDPLMKAKDIADLQNQFKDYQHVQELLQLTPPQALIWNDIVDLEPLSTYIYGRVVLLEDAAHATTPNMV